jgi:hypothetical protein
LSEKITVTCPQCNATGKAPASLAGKKVKCRKCGSVMQLPGAGGATAAPPPPPIVPGSTPRPAPPAPPPPAAAAGAKDEVLLADHSIDGSFCPACQKKIFLGDEVIRCAACGTVSHVHCFREKEGCRSATCAPQQEAAGVQDAAPYSGDTVPCPMCAEQIPADAEVCPLCSEPLTAAVGGFVDRHLMPTTFISSQAAKKWTFNLSANELTARAGKKYVSVSRSEAPSVTELKGRNLIIIQGGKRTKIMLDDIAYLAVEQWLTGDCTPRASAIAKDALITAIVGIFCCQIVLGIYALVRAGHAQAEIRQYPELITGEGMVLAARIIGAIDIVLFVLGMLGRAGQFS